MIHLLVAWRNIMAKPLQSCVTAAVVAIALTLTVVVMLLASGIQKGLIRASEPFDLIVGAKGSPNQLVLNTVFLQDVPIGNINHSIVDDLSANPLVDTAIPIGFGDNYRGYRIVGTTAEIFKHTIRAGQPSWIKLATGREFSQSFEAVIGAKTASELGLKVGDQFASSHGVVTGGEQHAQTKFTVVGIMEPVQGPYDQGIFVSLDSIWKLHDHANNPSQDEVVTNQQEQAHGNEQHAEEDEHELEHENEHEQAKATTVILVKPKGYAEAMRLYQQFQKHPQAQMVFPSQVVVRLFAIFGEGEKVLQTIAIIVLAMALITVALTLYWSTLSRARDRAVLRAIGAKKSDLFRIVLLEGLILIVAGVSIGIAFGHGLFTLIVGAMQTKTAVVLVGGFSIRELYLISLTFAAGILASVAPALFASRSDVTEYL